MRIEIEDYLRERFSGSLLTRVEAIDRHAIDAYLITLPDRTKHWIRVCRDSSGAGRDFIEFEQ